MGLAQLDARPSPRARLEKRVRFSVHRAGTLSFIRRQVNARSGAVEKDGSTVVVTSVSDATMSREFYRVIDDDSFVYSIDLSNDAGGTWNRGSIEFTMNRVE